MGDSAVIRFWQDTKDEHPLGIYLHWGGGTYAEALSEALRAAKDRYDDPDYANRIAIQKILEVGGIVANDLGAGLFVGTDSRGEDHDVLNVNWADQVVWTDEWRIDFTTFTSDTALWRVLQS